MTILLTGLVLPLLAVPAGAGGDAVAGEAAYATCISCHGAGGEGIAAVRAPAIAHLGETYLASQLGKFRSGERGGSGDSSEAMQMRAMALTLADDVALADVAAYVASLPASAGEQTIEGNATLGADYYNQFCGACHGPAAEGNPALDSPALAGASDWYLLAQLRAFREGVRGSHPDDRGGRQMRAMAAILPHEQALQDVVSFIAAIGRAAHGRPAE